MLQLKLRPASEFNVQRSSWNLQKLSACLFCTQQEVRRIDVVPLVVVNPNLEYLRTAHCRSVRQCNSFETVLSTGYLSCSWKFVV